MTPDELLTHLEAELARCRDERDRLRAELEGALAARDEALRESALRERELIAAETERDRLNGALHSLVGSKSWLLTRPLRRLTGSDRPEATEDL
jgi:chromosome segregation ATPase